MHKLILAVALALSAATASAMEVGRIKNSGGGYIVLTDAPCGDGKNRSAYTYGDNSSSAGCWAAINKEIFIRWLDDGQIRIYPMDAVRLSEEFKEYVKGSQK